jgi:hypothetical protein
MARGEARSIGWFPLQGSWEESVLSWNEQIDLALRHRRQVGLRGQKGNLALKTTAPVLSEDSRTANKEAKQAPLAS